MSSYIKASEYCVSVFDGTHDTPKPVGYGKTLVTSKNILGGMLNLDGSYRISLSDYESIQKRSAVSQWDIMFSMIGSVGEVYLETNEHIDYAIKNVGVFSTLNEDKAKWLYLYLTSPYAKKFIENYMTGAVQKFLGLGVLRDFPVIPYDGSKKPIVNLISALDNKINNNRKINGELEQIVHALYDYWFIQFDFPNNGGSPYKSSGGQMNYNSELKREIPIGWKTLKLQDALEFEKGTEPGADAYSDEQNAEFDSPFYRVGDIEGETHTYINSKMFNTKSVQLGDVVVTFDGSVGKMGLGLNGAISGGLRHIYDKTGKISDAGVYAIFGNEYITKTIEGYATGSVILHASSSIPYLVIPYDEDVFISFQKVIDPMYSKIIANRQESQELAKLRDWLLPMLMNGQVKVGNG